MDTLTQGLLGASVGQALYARRLGRRAVVWGALVALAPDLDIVLHAVSPMADWLYHRGPTHALAFGPVVGPVIGWLLCKWKGGRLRDWIGLAIAALVTHPLLDVFTSYGTQIAWPFSRARVAFDAVAIIDPIVSLALAACLVLALRWGVASKGARTAAWVALVSCSAYLMLGLAVHARAETIAREQLASEGESGGRVSAYPTMFQLPIQRIVVRCGDEVRVGWVNVLAPEPIAWSRFTSANGPLVDAARQTYEAQVLEWFAMQQVAARIERTADGFVVILDDLRYGMPDRPQRGLWGVRVRLDAEGQPIGPGERFRRSFSLSARQTVGLASRPGTR